jgi:hypothetical protein
MRSLLISPAVAISALALCLAEPALAADGISIPEPTDITLFALAFAGLVIGRMAARGRKRDDT